MYEFQFLYSLANICYCPGISFPTVSFSLFGIEINWLWGLVKKTTLMMAEFSATTITNKYTSPATKQKRNGPSECLPAVDQRGNTGGSVERGILWGKFWKQGQKHKWIVVLPQNTLFLISFKVLLFKISFLCLLPFSTILLLPIPCEKPVMIPFARSFSS